jgi:hypothetical protein
LEVVDSMLASLSVQPSLTQASPNYRTFDNGPVSPSMTVIQVNSPYSQSLTYNRSKTAAIEKRVPVASETTVEWEIYSCPAQNTAQNIMQQPIYIMQQMPNFPLRKTEKPGEPPDPICERSMPIRERLMHERAAPMSETKYIDRYNIVEVPREVVKVVERKVEVPIERVIAYYPVANLVCGRPH